MTERKYLARTFWKRRQRKLKKGYLRRKPGKCESVIIKGIHRIIREEG